jgi:hypothetical protein
VLTPEAVEKLRRRRADGENVSFARDVWPAIATEVESVYYTALLPVSERSTFAARYVAAIAPEREVLLAEHAIPADRRWDWEHIARPYAGRQFTGRDDFRDWVLRYLRDDVEQARLGNVSGPLHAALDVLRDLRNEIRQIVDHGGIDGDSYRDELTGWYTPFNAFLSIGPPASRIEEMIALIEAGVLRMTGPGTQILIDTERPAFVAQSRLVPGPPVRATALIEARLSEMDLRNTADPLLRHMLDTEQCRPYRLPRASGGFYETGGLAVTERPYRVIGQHGEPHPRRFAYGIPTESVHWVTAAGVRPGVDSVTLADSDAIAAALRALAPALPAPTAPAGVVV